MTECARRSFASWKEPPIGWLTFVPVPKTPAIGFVGTAEFGAEAAATLETIASCSSDRYGFVVIVAGSCRTARSSVALLGPDHCRYVMPDGRHFDVAPVQLRVDASARVTDLVRPTEQAPVPFPVDRPMTPDIGCQRWSGLTSKSFGRRFVRAAGAGVREWSACAGVGLLDGRRIV